MDKNIVHIEIDEYFENIFAHYKSKNHYENEIICNFFLDTEEVSASICYQTDNTTDELRFFSLDLKITDNIQEFLMKIEEFNYFNIINKINIFYESLDQKVDGISFTFSNEFVLQSVMLLDQSFDMNKRIFGSDMDTILNIHQLTENDMADIMIAQHINIDSELINEVINLKVPDFDDTKESIVYFLEKFRHYEIKSLYSSKNNLIKVAINNFTDTLSNTNVKFISQINKVESLFITFKEHSFSFPFNIITTYNKITNNFDIDFAVRLRTLPSDTSFDLLLQITGNSNFSYIMKELQKQTKKINKPIDDVIVYLSSDLSLNKIFLNNVVTFDRNILELTECLSDVFFIKYLYFHHKDVVDSQNLEFFNDNILLDKPLHWPSVIDDYYKCKDDLFIIIKMSVI
jgi:hypothetical protein